MEEIKNLKNLKDEIISLKEGKTEIQTGVFLGENIKIEPNVFFDSSEGIIVIGNNTKIKANAILRGPLLIGKKCVINSFAEISHSKIGDVCKIGGEVEACVIQSYSNKQHHGFLGHSYVGSWVNIGGGTSNSDLKNTYSTVAVGGVDTGEIFMGCIIGDYVKTAINTSIYTGKIIGASSHIYGTVTEDVPAFTSYVSAGNMYELPLDIAIKIQKAMSARRGVEFTEADVVLFEKLFSDSQIDREKAGVKKEKLSFS